MLTTLALGATVVFRGDTMIKSYRFVNLVLLALLTSLHAASAVQPPLKSSIALKPCTVPNFKGDAKCGTFEVFENRATRKGRTIKLNILVLPATGRQHEPDPLFYFAGGPGSAATEEAAGVAQVLASVKEHRDLVFVDQRGTG